MHAQTKNATVFQIKTMIKNKDQRNTVFNNKKEKSKKPLGVCAQPNKNPKEKNALR